MRIVCVSDTHNTQPDLPDGDVLIHAGDLTVRGYRIEVYRQLGWLELNRQRYKEVTLTPGNHDLYFEEHWAAAVADCEAADIRLLHNSGLTIDGKTFYGSAHVPMYHEWAFMQYEDDIRQSWQKIPAHLDVLVTHGPPQGILDAAYRGVIGCPHLRDRVQEVPPRVHVFGHAHDGAGQVRIGPTLFVNTACRVTVFDI